MKIYKLGQIPEDLYSFVGGKARGLDVLIKNGFPVPKGFLITNLENIDEKEIFKTFDEIGLKKVSVRSSASLEDGENYSSAGQFETFLFVSRDNLIENINKCIESLNSDRVKEYISHFDINHENYMNIVVQEMIDSKVAGVMFTTDPLNVDKVLIEAVKGQGENLVSGKVSANRYLVSKYAYDGKGDSLLSSENLQKLYQIALKIRKIYKKEMDIEWAINGDLYLLQMRPITVDILDLTEFDRTDDLTNHLFTKRNVGEMMPGAVTPLTLSTSVYAIDYGMRCMLKKAGAFKKIDDVEPLRMISSFSNHLFFDMNLLYEMHKKVAITNPQSMNLSIMGEYHDYPKIEGKYACGFVRVINSIKFLTFVFSGNKSKKKIDTLVKKMKFVSDDSNALEIYNDITNNLKNLNQCLIYHYSASSYSGSSVSTLYMMLDEYFPDKSKYQSFVADLLSNIPNIESVDILDKLQEIAVSIKNIDPKMVNASEEEILDFIHSHVEIEKLYKAFLEKHGHRSIKEAELRSKPWKRDEHSLIAYLKSIMTSVNTLSQGVEEVDVKNKMAFVKKSLRPMTISYGKKCREAVVDREYTKSRMIKMIDLFKDRYLLLAKKMVEENFLPDEDLIYFFLHDEIKQVFEGDKEIVKKAELRRKALPLQEELSFDDVYLNRPIPCVSDSSDDKGSIKGVPISIGKIRGTIRIVNSIDDANKLVDGEIMVAKFTDIGWSPYYSRIKGLITEIGSSLSHGAVVAREYGLPTIVNVKRATRIFHNGDEIEMDANTGIITIIQGKNK